MPQTVACQKCAKKFKAPDELAGRKVLCPSCKHTIIVPAIGKPTASPAKALPNTTRLATAPSTAAKPTAAAPTACVIACSHCAKKFKGSPELNGKKLKCPACKAEFTVRVASVAAPISATTKPTPAPTPKLPAPPMPARPPAPGVVRPGAPITPLSKPTTPIAAKPTPTAKPAEPPAKAKSSRPRFLYCIFMLAFVPLILQTLADRENRKDDLVQRLEHTIETHPDIKAKEDEIESLDDLVALFPDGRIEGAHLSRNSRIHWLYAAIATALFFGVSWVLFERGNATIWHWLAVLAVTSTVGIISLIAFQFIAEITQGVWVTGRGVLVLLFYIVKFIGFSYHAALDDSYGFWASFFGFTFGVGLCEEITKAIPVLVLLHGDKKLGWRSACFLGIASGVGFGVAEGIMYAGHYYNGMLTADIYFTRFISCVALHATWTAAVGIFAYQNLAGFETNEALDWVKHLLLIISVPAILHGLYDTLLKRDMGMWALVVALASFGWLAFLIERARASDLAPRRALAMAG